jgi:hypothetical protein
MQGLSPGSHPYRHGTGSRGRSPVSLHLATEGPEPSAVAGYDPGATHPASFVLTSPMRSLFIWGWVMGSGSARVEMNPASRLGSGCARRH